MPFDRDSGLQTVSLLHTVSRLYTVPGVSRPIHISSSENFSEVNYVVRTPILAYDPRNNSVAFQRIHA